MRCVEHTLVIEPGARRTFKFSFQRKLSMSIKNIKTGHESTKTMEADINDLNTPLRLGLDTFGDYKMHKSKIKPLYHSEVQPPFLRMGHRNAIQAQ